MIKSFNQIQILLKRLETLKSNFQRAGKIFSYKITKQLNQTSTLHILCDEKIEDAIYADINNTDGYPPIDIRYIDKEDYNDDKAYWDKFFNSKSSFEGTTRRLDNAFGKYPSVQDKNLPPIVSFYSYKGGVGRSTTLAAFASFHARRT